MPQTAAAALIIDKTNRRTICIRSALQEAAQDRDALQHHSDRGSDDEHHDRRQRHGKQYVVIRRTKAQIKLYPLGDERMDQIDKQRTGRDPLDPCRRLWRVNSCLTRFPDHQEDADGFDGDENGEIPVKRLRRPVFRRSDPLVQSHRQAQGGHGIFKK